MFQVLMFSLLAVGIGLVFTFSGYRFFRVLLPLWAFFAGLTFGLSAFDALMGSGFLSTSLGLIIGFFVGLALAAVAYFAYSFAVILFGASVGYSIGAGLLLVLGFQPSLMTWIAGVVVAILFVVLFLVLRMPTFLVVFGTAFGGAMMMIMGLFVLFGQIPAEIASTSLTRVVISDSFIWMLIWVVIAGFGIAVQYMSEKEINLMKEYSLEPVKE